MPASHRSALPKLLARLASLAALAAAIALALRAAPRERDPLADAAIAKREGAPRPNVLLVTIGSLRRDHVGAYGYGWETTPTIDALASEGVRFKTVVAPSSWSLPADASLLTAKFPEDHGVVKPTDRLAASVVTLPEVYAHAGYATAAFVASPLLSSRFGFAQGFETYDDTSAARLAWNAQPNGFTSPALIERALRFLRDWAQKEPRRPFFLFVNVWDVHPEFAAQTRDAAGARLDAEALQRRIGLYDKALRHADTQLGRLLHTLRQLGVFDETIVAVTSDHGEEFLEHGGLGAGRTLFDEVLLVPFVLRWAPHVAAGRVVVPQARLVDIAPTLLSLSGIPRPGRFGAGGGALHREQSFAPWLGAVPLDQDLPRLIALASTALAEPPLDAVRSDTGKLLVPGRWRERRAAYDLEADPGETKDLVPDNLGAGSDLMSLWLQWQSFWETRRDLARRMQGAP